MNETELASTWHMLEPTSQQRRRIEARLHQWLDARETSLAAEWLGLIKVAPLAGLGLAAVGSCLVLVATPLSWLALTVL